MAELHMSYQQAVRIVEALRHAMRALLSGSCSPALTMQLEREAQTLRQQLDDLERQP